MTVESVESEAQCPFRLIETRRVTTATADVGSGWRLAALLIWSLLYLNFIERVSVRPFRTHHYMFSDDTRA